MRKLSLHRFLTKVAKLTQLPKRAYHNICVVLIKRVFIERYGKDMNLEDAIVGEEYIVRDIDAEDEELKSFLFSLGCYTGEPITVISHIKGGCVVSIKDARYNIDNDLARAISV